MQKRNLFRNGRFFLALGLWLLVQPLTAYACGGDVICVDADATGAATGLSWTDAFTNVQDALGAATSGAEIWVAEGIYYPDEGAGTIADSLTMSFTLRYNNVQLYGGFPTGGGDWADRDWDVHPTILSGDLQQDDTTVNEVVTYTDAISGTNAYHVLYLDGTTTPITGTTAIDGFVITAGKAHDPSSHEGYGGGLYCMRASPTLTNITFSGNYADWGGGMLNDYSDPTLAHVTFSGNQAIGGGGIYNFDSDPTLTNVTLSGNYADWGGGMYNEHTTNLTLTHVTLSGNRAKYGGGGIYNEYSSLTLTNVTFSGNYADWGGGMVNDSSDPTLTNVTLSGNTADDGGGMYNFDSDPTLTNVTLSGNYAGLGGGMYNYTTTLTLINVTLSGNRADYKGGGMYNDESNPTLTNVTLSGNTAGDGDTAGDGGGMYNDESNPTLTNVILWGNYADFGGNELYNYDAAPVLSYTLVATATGDIYNDTSTVTYGDGMLYTDPQFVAPITATAAPTTTGNYRLQAGSPAIDAGDNSASTVPTDLDGNPRICNGVVDMGAYEAHPALVLGKSVTPATNAPYHGLVTYTVALSNSGFADDPQVLFTDTLTTLPVAFARWIVSPTNTSLAGGEITWSGTVTTGEAITWTWTVTHTGDYGETVTNTARFSGTTQTGQAQAGFSVEPNYAPALGVIRDRSVEELTELTFTATATDANVNDTLAFTLDAGSAGSITPGGGYTWTPTEADGPGVYTATVRVSDGALEDVETLTITVNEVNTAPALAAIGDKTVDELSELTFTATATDADIPTQTLTYTLDAGSAGSLTPGGDYTWTPTEAQGPGTYTATVRVTDGELDDVETLTITVNEVNTAPVLAAISDKTVDELTELAFTATATDADLPAQPLTYTLDAGSAGGLTPGGDYTWTPTEADGPGVYTATVRVSDGALEDSETITITVNEVNVAPTADAGADQHVTLGNVATLDGSGSDDPDVGDSLTYRWTQTDGPAVTLNNASAPVSTFTASLTGTFTFQLTVTDTAPFGNGGGLSDSDTTVVTITAPSVPTHTLTIYIEGQGDVTRIPAGTAIVPLQSYYFSGTQVTLSASAADGWAFAHWTGDLESEANTEQITMDADKVITATFSQTPPPTYTLDVRIAGNGSVAVDPDQSSYISGTEVTLTPQPAAGWYFTSWAGDLSGAANPALVTMDADKAITATFSQTQPRYIAYLPLILAGNASASH